MTSKGRALRTGILGIGKLGHSAAARRFLSERDLAPSTRRVYGATLDALAAEGGRMIGQSHCRGISVLLGFKTRDLLRRDPLAP